MGAGCAQDEWKMNKTKAIRFVLLSHLFQSLIQNRVRGNKKTTGYHWDKKPKAGMLKLYNAKNICKQWRIFAASSGTSIFGPVLCELAYKWFNVPNGKYLIVLLADPCVV